MGAGDTDRGEFAIRLRRLREAASLTQEELAARAGLTSNAIGALERGERRRPYPHTVRALAEALGADAEELAALTTAARPAAESATPPAPGHLPVPRTPLLGRATELEEIAQLLREGPARLVTVTGPGGVGKTRLALAVAGRLAEERTVAVAELAAVSDPDLVLVTVARALGLRDDRADGLVDRLALHLDGPRRLLVLDNVEHVVGTAGPVLARLVDRCPGLVVLATSRTPLRVRGEQEYPLDPLPVPRTAHPAAVAESPAAQMFCDRARAVRPGFALDETSAPAVAAICERLDGLPLALELAAVHTRLLGPRTLLARLDRAIDSAALRDLPARQSTMRATMDWSHDLLTAHEQRLLRLLAVFRGGFTLEAVEVVVDGSVDAFTALGGLVEQSLVLPDPRTEGRYRLLEPVRQYAADRLTAAGEHGAVAARHAHHVADRARAARDGLRGPDQRAWLDELQTEHGNVRAALTTLLAAGDAGTAATLLADTWLSWALRGAAGEGMAWARTVAEQDRDLALEDRAAARLALGGLSFATGDLSGTRDAATAATADLTRSTADPARLAEALVLQGYGAAGLGDADAARSALDAAVALARETADRWALAHALAARATLVGAQDPRAARPVLDEAEATARQLASPFTTATVLNLRAALLLAEGEDGAAVERLGEAADLAVEVGTTWTLVVTLAALGVVAARRGLPETATILMAAGAATSDTSAAVVAIPLHRDVADRHLLEARAHLDDETFRRAWEMGRALRPTEIDGYVSRVRERCASR